MNDVAMQPAALAPEDRVPVDQRWLGMDRRGFPYAIVAVALIVVLVWVIPAVNDAVEWDDPTVAGDVLDLGGGITVTPPVGWQLEAGVRVGADTAGPVNADGSSTVLADGATTISITGAGWDGTADELMDQYNSLRDRSDQADDQLFAVTGTRGSFTTAAGLTGVSEAFESASGSGRAFAFVVDDDGGRPIGVVIAASTGGDTLGDAGGQLDDLVASLTTGASS